MKGVMTMTETAYYLGVTEDALYQSIKDKSAPHHRWGRKIIRELDEWLAKLPGVSVAEALKRITKEDPIRQDTPARTALAVNETPSLPQARSPWFGDRRNRPPPRTLPAEN
jgi:excisionase family DNA binding protein